MSSVGVVDCRMFRSGGLKSTSLMVVFGQGFFSYELYEDDFLNQISDSSANGIF